MGTDDSRRSELPAAPCVSQMTRVSRSASSRQTVLGSTALGLFLILLFLLSGEDDEEGSSAASRLEHTPGHRQWIAQGFLDDDGSGGGNHGGGGASGAGGEGASEPGMVTVSFHAPDNAEGTTEPILLRFHADGEFLPSLAHPHHHHPHKRNLGREGSGAVSGEAGETTLYPFGVVEAGEALTVFTNPGAVWSAWRRPQGCCPDDNDIIFPLLGTSKKQPFASLRD